MLENLLPNHKVSIRTLRKSEELFAQGARAFAIFEVLDGAVQLQRHTLGGKAIAIYTATVGSSLAEASLFSEYYHCGAVAMSPSRVRCYQKSAVLAALRADPKVMEKFLAKLASQVQSLRFQVEVRNTKSAEDRVLLYLEGTADMKTRRKKLAGPVQNIAPELGLTREALYRALGALEKRGAVRRAQGYLELL